MHETEMAAGKSEMGAGKAIVTTILVLLIVGILSFGIGISVEGCKWEDRMVERGHANYNSETGDWQWNDAYSKKEKIDAK